MTARIDTPNVDTPNSTVQQQILARKASLAESVGPPLAALAGRATAVWPDADALDALLLEEIARIPLCHALYCWDVNGIELSSMVQPGRVDSSWRGRDLSARPYLKNNLPFKGIMLSSVYLSQYVPTLCVTALQAVNRAQELLGFIAADFELKDLLADVRAAAPARSWQQFRGDPSVRGTVFLQTRVTSLLDQHIEEVHALIERLMCEHGVFHAKIHYSSGRTSLWLLDDPYNYRLHDINEIVNPDLCLAYPLHGFPDNAAVTPAQVRAVLHEFRQLRFADETIYLRSGSLNIMNGMVGLTFSCDGSHYMSVSEFLEKDMAFWIGARG
jgi:hypothetical protein